MRSLLILLPLIALTAFAKAPKGELPAPELTEDWSRKPAAVIPATKKTAPSDAIVLFDKGNLDSWVKNYQGETSPAHWIIEGNHFTVNNKEKGGIQSKQAFGDCQLHIEWRSPAADVEAGLKGQKNGNSGIFLMGRYEVQVLNSYQNETYYNGMAASIYKQHIPLINASTPAGTWQTYDIIFKAPRFKENGKIETPASITVIHNGILSLYNAEIKGPTVFRGTPKYKKHGTKAPLTLQNHNNAVSYRNIWIREL